jgi:hypothetical protein
MIPAECSISRLANDETHPIRIAVNVAGCPHLRIVVLMTLEDFALTLTGRGGAGALIEKNNLPPVAK